MVVCSPHPEEANHRFSCLCLSQEIMQVGQAIFIPFRLAKPAMWDSSVRDLKAGNLGWKPNSLITSKGLGANCSLF